MLQDVDQMTERALREDIYGRAMRAAVAAEGHAAALPPDLEAKQASARAANVCRSIRRLRAQGLLDREIAERLGITRPRVTQIRREMGVA